MAFSRTLCRGFVLAATVAIVVSVANSANEGGDISDVSTSLRNYGYLTLFNISEAAARETVRTLHRDFGIVDFQFYDAFYTYSQPVHPTRDSWISKPSGCFTKQPRVVHAATIKAYTDEIRKLPGGLGRSWMYVQAVAADEPMSHHITFLPYTHRDGTQVSWNGLDGNHCLYTYLLSSKWAAHMVDLWAPAAVSLGFDGIHWDQLGRVSDDASQNAMMARGIRDFLQGARQRLNSKFGLAQTFNFVDGFGWHESLYSGERGSGTVEFPYWECWSDATEWIFWSLFNFSQQASDRSHDRGHAVFARYPGPGCCGNPDSSPLDDLMWERWMRAASGCTSYLVLGDGDRHLVNEYFPSGEALTDFERAAMTMAAREAGQIALRHCANANRAQSTSRTELQIV
jgi:hypothetical protein